MRTPDEIKKGLECCSTKKPCTSCPMYDECKEASSLKPLWDNSLSYIQQLEAANAKALNLCKQLEAKCHQLERERDAMVTEFKAIDCPCNVCKHLKKSGSEAPCNSCIHIFKGEKSCFEWRVVKEDKP